MSRVEAVQFTCGACGAVNRLSRQTILNLTGSPLCGRCDTPLLRAYEGNLDNLDPSSYIHPLDKETLDALKRIPGVSTLLRSLIRHSFELATRLHHHANFVRVGPTQLPSLWKLFEKAANALGVKTLPELYVYQDPVPNAYTFGVDQYFIAVSTGCLELLEEDEILCVLAHELGHVHADHVLYKSAARVFGSVAGTIIQATLGVGSLIVYPIQLALLRWDRASELSSDRAALLVVKNPQTVLRTLMKISGGTRRYAHDLSIDAFVEQADSFGKMQDEGPLGRYIAVFQTLFRSHPFPIWRTKEMLDWVTTGNYLEILDGEYQVLPPPSPEEAAKADQKNHQKYGVDGDDAGQAGQAGQAANNAGNHASAHAKNDAAGSENPSPEIFDAPMDAVSKAWSDVKSWYKKNFTDAELDPMETSSGASSGTPSPEPVATTPDVPLQAPVEETSIPAAPASTAPEIIDVPFIPVEKTASDAADGTANHTVPEVIAEVVDVVAEVSPEVSPEMSPEVSPEASEVPAQDDKKQDDKKEDQHNPNQNPDAASDAPVDPAEGEKV